MQMNIYVTDPRYRFNRMYCFYNIILYGNEYSVSITLYYMQMNIYVTDPRYRFNRMYCFYNIILYANEYICY